MKSILTIKSTDKLLTVVYDHSTGKFTPDVEHDENCLRIIDNAIVESHTACLMWPDFDDLKHVKEYRGRGACNFVWFEENKGTPDEKLLFLSFLCKVRLDIDDNGNVKFVKDRYARHDENELDDEDK